MSENRVSILQRVAENLRNGKVMDVYEIVADVAKEHPEMPEEQLERLVSEEVVKSGGAAYWGRRSAR